MANLDETSNFDAGVLSLETTDDVKGSVQPGDPNLGAGNGPHINLANRTKFLKDTQDTQATSIANNTGNIAQNAGSISSNLNSINSNSLAISANSDLANTKVAQGGDTMTGQLILELETKFRNQLAVSSGSLVQTIYQGPGFKRIIEGGTTGSGSVIIMDIVSGGGQNPSHCVGVILKILTTITGASITNLVIDLKSRIDSLPNKLLVEDVNYHYSSPSHLDAGTFIFIPINETVIETGTRIEVSADIGTISGGTIKMMSVREEFNGVGL